MSAKIDTLDACEKRALRDEMKMSFIDYLDNGLDAQHRAGMETKFFKSYFRGFMSEHDGAMIDDVADEFKTFIERAARGDYTVEELTGIDGPQKKRRKDVYEKDDRWDIRYVLHDKTRGEKIGFNIAVWEELDSGFYLNDDDDSISIDRIDDAAGDEKELCVFNRAQRGALFDYLNEEEDFFDNHCGGKDIVIREMGFPPELLDGLIDHFAKPEAVISWSLSIQDKSSIDKQLEKIAQDKNIKHKSLLSDSDMLNHLSLVEKLSQSIRSDMAVSDNETDALDLITHLVAHWGMDINHKDEEDHTLLGQLLEFQGTIVRLSDDFYAALFTLGADLNAHDGLAEKITQRRGFKGVIAAFERSMLMKEKKHSRDDSLSVGL